MKAALRPPRQTAARSIVVVFEVGAEARSVGVVARMCC
jgi:hypothetical protein